MAGVSAVTCTGVPLPGTAYSVGPSNAGLPATRASHYPAEGICDGCGQVIRCDDVRQAGWTHTGRMPGDPR